MLLKGEIWKMVGFLGINSRGLFKTCACWPSAVMSALE